MMFITEPRLRSFRRRNTRGLLLHKPEINQIHPVRRLIIYNILLFYIVMKNIIVVQYLQPIKEPNDF